MQKWTEQCNVGLLVLLLIITMSIGIPSCTKLELADKNSFNQCIEKIQKPLECAASLKLK